MVAARDVMSTSNGLRVQDAKVLMVGAGGIGCELLKTLVLSGFTFIHVVRKECVHICVCVCSMCRGCVCGEYVCAE